MGAMMAEMQIEHQGFTPFAALQSAALDALRAELVALGLVLPGQSEALRDDAAMDATFDVEFDNMPV